MSDLSVPSALTIVFRRSGWHWPVRAGVTVRVYDSTGRRVAEVPGGLLRALLQRRPIVGELAARSAGDAR
jgi:hypothetical protein